MKAVIPVAGLGTRMLPATKAIPKEMLPVVDRPLIQYVVSEAVAAGIKEIVLVTHSSKNSIENHFDTSFELDEELSTSINFTAFEPMVLAAKKSKIKRFIYASTSSVYGVSNKPNVTEEHPLVPLTLYNKYKGMCEPLLIKHTDDNFVGVIFRPATVCGYAPRLRLDLSVNILTNHAVNKNKIMVFGGKQLRPNLHIKDYCEAVETLLIAKNDKIENQIFNVGYQNMSINKIANLVKEVVKKEYPNKDTINIIKTSSSDNRSYHINSEKIKKILGFEAKRTIAMAIKDLCNAFKQGKIINSFENDLYFNVSRLKNIKAK